MKYETVSMRAAKPVRSDDARPGDSYLRIDNVWKTFGDFAALKDVSLAIDEGEFICFLGPSGCGKTTLLRAIAGLDPQTRGAIHQGGKDISTLPASKRDYGIVFQSYALFPNLTVEKNIAFGLENTGHPRAEINRRVAELLSLVGLPDQGRKYPAQLSGGQQQRIALARAIAISPGLLLLDEPLSALDAKVRVHLRHEIKELQRKLGVTTVMVTHDQEEALSMADRIVVMNHGVIEQVGTPTEVYRHPATLFVADFIGETNKADTRFNAGKVTFGSTIDLLQLKEPQIAQIGVGRKFQRPTVFEAQTVRDNLMMALKKDRSPFAVLTFRPETDDHARIETLAAEIGLEPGVLQRGDGARAGRYADGRRTVARRDDHVRQRCLYHAGRGHFRHGGSLRAPHDRESA